MFSIQEKQRIIEVLNRKLREHGSVQECPMCRHQDFTIADAYLNHFLQEDIKVRSIGGQSIPTVAIICKNCGLLSQHAIGVLGLIPEKEVKK